MSHSGLLERLELDQDEWIDVVAPPEVAEAGSATAPIFAAFAALQVAIDRGESRGAIVDGDFAVDELDDAAIQAFFAESD